MVEAVFCCASFFVLIGNAETLLPDLAGLFETGGVRPAGEAMELGKIKSSRFMGSGEGPL